MMILYQFDFSPFCVKVRAILNLKQLPYRPVEVIPLVTQGQVERASGQRQVPVLIDGEAAIVDSTEIALYLERRCPSPPILPAEARARREALRWDDWADDTLAPPLRALAFDAARQDPSLGREQLPPFGSAALDLLMPRVVPLATRAMMRHYRITEDTIRQAGPKAQRALELVAAEVEGRGFLVGEELTLADISVAAILKEVELIGGLREQPRFARLRAWRDGVLTRCGEPVA